MALAPTPVYTLVRQECSIYYSGGGGGGGRSDLSPCNDPRTIVGINTMNSV